MHEQRSYPKVSLNIVTWNSMRFLPDLLESISKQTYRDFSVLIIDNGSTDGIEAFLRERYPSITFLRNARNLGFSGAHNQGIRYALDHWDPETYHDRFVLVTNPDIIMTETFLETLMNETTDAPQVGSFGGKLLRAFGENLNDEVLSETVKSDLLDSTGLRVKKNRTCADRGAGEMDKQQFDTHKDVFGLSGALVMYRANALQDARYNDEFFDHDFFAYKEDVDLAWRLQHLGWDARYIPAACSYHYRGMFGREAMGWFERMKNRRGKSSTRSYYSNRNQWMMLMKNLRFSNGLLSFHRVFGSEVARFVYSLVFETKNSKAFLDAFALMPKMMRKRKDTLKRAKKTSKEVRTWFV